LETKGDNYHRNMTIATALAINPPVMRDVLAEFRVNGCTICGEARTITIEQVCSRFELDVEAFLTALEAGFSQAG